LATAFGKNFVTQSSHTEKGYLFNWRLSSIATLLILEAIGASLTKSRVHSRAGMLKFGKFIPNCKAVHNFETDLPTKNSRSNMKRCRKRVLIFFLVRKWEAYPAELRNDLFAGSANISFDEKYMTPMNYWLRCICITSGGTTRLSHN